MSDSSFWGSGWAFPPTFDAANNYQVNMVHKEANIDQSINTILDTRRGERSLVPDFGSNLDSYLFKNMDSTLKGEIINSVKACLLDHEPRIDVKQVTVDFINIESVSVLETVVKISIHYVIRKTNTRHNHVYPFHINEGSELTLTR